MEFSNGVEEELLFCKSLPSTLTAEESFKCCDGFVQENEIQRWRCVGLTTDGASAISLPFTQVPQCVKLHPLLSELTAVCTERP